MKAAHLVILLCGAIPAVAQVPGKATPDLPTVKEFNRRVADYMKLHKTVQSDVHRIKPTNSPEEIVNYQQQLARRLVEARASAAQGSIFTPRIGQEFRRLIGITMGGPHAAEIRRGLQQGAPAQTPVLHVNSEYPSGVPLPSAPPSLLLNLPPLPAELEYRVVGHTLLIRDIDANLVVDLIPNAIP